MNAAALVCRRTGFRRAFTMIEAVASVVIISMMLVAALGSTAASVRVAAAQKDLSRAESLGRQLLDEILQQSYSNPGGNNVFGPEAGEVRATFDDVDDYHGLVDSPPAGPDGVALAGFTGWQRAVTVDFVSPSAPNTVVASDMGLKRVTVTVTSPAGKVTRCVGLRSQYSLYQKSPPTTQQVTLPSWVGIQLQVGTDPKASAATSVNPVNQWP